MRKNNKIFYWSRIYSKQIKSGEDYSKLKRTIIVLIADFKIDELEEVGYHSSWKIIETKNKTILTNKLEIDIIELPKIEGKEEGRVEEKIEIAKKMLLKKLTIEEIIDFTGLTKEEIAKINS